MRNRITVWFGAASLAAVVLFAVPVGAAADQGQGNDVTSHQVTSFDGINHFIDRPLAGASIEPPEQGLCVGNGYVVESVASAIAIYDTNGNLLHAPISLNQFYGYPPVVQGPPTARVFGPHLNDPGCYFDAATQRWFHVALTVDVMASNGAPTGVNHVDIAVSQTADPTGAWSFVKLYAQNDCAAGGPPWANPNACLGDFPRIGADSHGFYVTTNDYSFFTHVFRSASLYALSKVQLETNTSAATAQRIDTAGMVGGQSGFTLSPAESPNAESSGSGNLDTSRGGTEFFLSSNAADEVNAAHSRTSQDLVVWALSNTESLDSDQPALQLTNTVLSVDAYSFPPPAQQKAGPTPMAECLNNTSMALPPPIVGTGCWRLIVPNEPTHAWTEGQSIDTGDTRMQQVVFAGGIVYGALGTAVTVDGSTHAGIEWFAVRPHVEAAGVVNAQLVEQDHVAKANTSLSFPAIAVNGDGQGAIAFSLMGPNDYPSAAYVSFDLKRGTGDIQYAAHGVGPDDGYTNYAAAFGQPPRTRWGDYGAAVVDGSTIWMASEYIGQACDFVHWLQTGMTCDNTRRGAANWDTRITAVTVSR